MRLKLRIHIVTVVSSVTTGNVSISREGKKEMDMLDECLFHFSIYKKKHVDENAYFFPQESIYINKTKNNNNNNIHDYQNWIIIIIISKTKILVISYDKR